MPVISPVILNNSLAGNIPVKRSPLSFRGVGGREEEEGGEVGSAIRWQLL